MTETIARTRVLIILATATDMTILAEMFYLVVWGVLLFPGGSLMAKIVWTAVCGIAMGAVIGSATLAFVEGHRTGATAWLAAASIMAAVGSACAVLCGQIDRTFDYFGGPENWRLFIWSGIIPAILGGPVYGWLLYFRKAV